LLCVVKSCWIVYRGEIHINKCTGTFVTLFHIYIQMELWEKQSCLLTVGSWTTNVWFHKLNTGRQHRWKTRILFYTVRKAILSTNSRRLHMFLWFITNKIEDLQKPRRRKTSTAISHNINYSLLKDGVHPNNILAKLWLIRITIINWIPVGNIDEKPGFCFILWERQSFLQTVEDYTCFYGLLLTKLYIYMK
jgi:hypothetical protein